MAEQLSDMTECSLCMESCTNPKALPCIHTFCLKCLQSYGSNQSKKPGQQMQCPLCNASFVIPVGGFDSLPNNFFVEKLLDIQGPHWSTSAVFQQMSNITKCALCQLPCTKPKALPCIHTFCLKCLQLDSHGKGKKPGQQTQCPLCSNSFVLPLGGFDSLPGNFLVEKLLVLDIQDSQSQHGTIPFLINRIASTGNAVQGLTLLMDSLYAVRYCEKHITEYNATSLNHVQKINIPLNMNSTLDIASCATYNCLYISDYWASIIHRVQLPTNTLTKWSMTDRPYTLSVTFTNNVLVTCQNKNKICEFSTHGVLLRQVPLQLGIDCPQHTILLPSGLFLLCHWGRSQSGLLMISSDRQIIASYNCFQQSGNPRYMVVHDGMVLVAADVRQALLLTADLTCVRDLITNDAHGLDVGSRRLCLDKTKGHLFIASNYGDIQVYQIKID